MNPSQLWEENFDFGRSFLFFQVDEVAEAEANTEYHLPLEPSKNLSRLELGDLSQGLPSKRERCVKFKLEAGWRKVMISCFEKFA